MSKKMKESSTRCTWSDPDNAMLAGTLHRTKDKGYQSDNGWKPQVWALCVKDLKDSPGPPKLADKIQDHMAMYMMSLKVVFLMVKHLHELSGFGWNEGLKLVTASDEIWQAYLRGEWCMLKHPKSKRWWKSTFPLYNDIAYLVDGIVTTGAAAFHAGGTSQAQTETEGQMQTQSDDENTPQLPITPLPPCCRPAASTQTLPDDNLTASSPVHPRCRKRAASSSPNNEGCSSCQPCKRNADSTSEVTAALRQVAGSMKVASSPEIRECVVKQLEDDGDFSEDDGADIMILFTDDSAIAQTYLASDKKDRRTAFLARSLQEA
ncbi:hypothetical protein FB451DRAFT_1266486 [Mycena latifolia]|nr:hypothetical protein FB451DRAFT_1266486 [Mycena latifolia]